MERLRRARGNTTSGVRSDGVTVELFHRCRRQADGAMAYKSESVGRLFVLRWLTPPQSGDLKALGREMVELRRTAGEQLLNISLISEDISPPEAAVRKEMEVFNQIWMDLCESIHVVVGGTGFKHAVFRSIVSAFALASRRRGLVHVHKTLDEAILEIQKFDGQSPNLRTQLLKNGIIDGFK
jgi:hypothetical protein